MKEEAENWLNKADEDLATAEDCVRIKRFHASAFYSQQAAEKALKAMQIQLLDRFDRVHDLLMLANSVKAPKEVTNYCTMLTPYYTITRYPDVGDPITPKTAQELVGKSKGIVEWVKRTLK